MVEELVRRFFEAADSLNPTTFQAVLPEEVTWRFANFPIAEGRDAVMGQYHGVLGRVTSMRHDIVGVWRADGCVIAETHVFYVDRFGRKFDFPACDLFFLEDGEIKEIRVFVDNHALFEDPAKD